MAGDRIAERGGERVALALPSLNFKLPLSRDPPKWPEGIAQVNLLLAVVYESSVRSDIELMCEVNVPVAMGLSLLRNLWRLWGIELVMGNCFGRFWGVFGRS